MKKLINKIFGTPFGELKKGDIFTYADGYFGKVDNESAIMVDTADQFVSVFIGLPFNYDSKERVRVQPQAIKELYTVE